jgi:crossover junction endodeoxyribonuclease RusA
MSIILRLDYPPSANRYWRCFRNRMVPSAAATAYKKHVKTVAQTDGLVLHNDSICVNIKLLPKLTAKGEASKVILDLDNCLKVALDALQGVIIENDNQVKEIHASYGVPTQNGGLIVEVTRIEDAKV